MDQAQREMLEKYKDLCRRSLHFLCEEVLKYQDWDRVHDDIEKMMLRPSKRKLILVPRGHLKSAIVTKAFTIQQLLKDPNRRVLIAHEVWDKSREILSEIKEYLTNKSDLPLVFGQFQSERWNADQIVIKQRTKALSAPSIGTTGVESEMTSTHFDVIICDDLQGTQNTQTKEQRDKVKRFLSSMVDLLEPGGLLVVVGTRWHLDDVYAHILENESEYYDVMVRKVVEDGRLIFPKKFSLKFDDARKTWVPTPGDDKNFDYLQLLKKKHDYYAQYENNPIDESDALFKRDQFRYWSDRPKDIFTYMAVDLAISSTAEADYTAIPVLGMDKDWNIYVLDYLKGRWTPGEIVNNIFEMQSKWKPNGVGMEVNGFQRMLKMAVEEEMRRRGQYFGIDEIHNGSDKSKESRIKSLEPFYRDKKVFHAQWMKGKDMEWELMAFPKAKHDDVIDAMSMALPFLSPGVNPQAEGIRPGTYEWILEEARRQQNRHDGYFNI